jgi:hypothetical protein
MQTQVPIITAFGNCEIKVCTLINRLELLSVKAKLALPSGPDLLFDTAFAALLKDGKENAMSAVARSLTVSIVSLWIAIPLISIFWVFFSLISILFNDSGNARQQVVPFLNRVLLFDFALVILLIWAIRTRRALVQMLPSARSGMLILSVAYIAIAIFIASSTASFPNQLVLLPGAVALLPGVLGAWWLIYFMRPATRRALKNDIAIEGPPPNDPTPPPVE